MALTKTIQLPTGITVENAYNRVANVSIIGKDRVRFSLTAHVDAGKIAFTSQEFDAPYDMNGANPIAQAYGHLKTLPEFVDAQDC